jgi:hypothetical protein
VLPNQFTLIDVTDLLLRLGFLSDRSTLFATCVRPACALLDPQVLSQLHFHGCSHKHNSQRPARLRSHTTTSHTLSSIMDDHAQLPSDDSSESQTHNMDQASTAEQLPALKPTTIRPQTTSRHPPPTQRTAPPCEPPAFLASLTAHYATRSDVVTPHIFTQHCKDFHTGKSDENAFYVSVYRLFCATDAQHLMQGFRAFLPSAWKSIELGWLDRAVEEDVKRQARESRELTASLVALLEGSGGVPRVQAGGALLSDDDEEDAAAVTKRRFSGDHAEALVGTPAAKKKRVPVNSYRSTTSRVPTRLVVESSTSSPEPTPPPPDHTQTVVSAETPVIKKKGNIMNVFRSSSSPKIPSRLAQSTTSSPVSTPAPTKKALRRLVAKEK